MPVRRDQILSGITKATEIFLRGSLVDWQKNVLEVLQILGKELDLKRIYLCKKELETTSEITTGVRYEWFKEGDKTTFDTPALQGIKLIESGFSRWVDTFKQQQIISSRVCDLPLNERGWFISDHTISFIGVPVFVEDQWWGFLGIEDFYQEDDCSPAEIDALKTVAVIFGAAIRRKRTEEALEREQKRVEQKVREIEDIARFPKQDPSPVMRVSEDGVILYANEASKPLLVHFEVKLGYKVPEQMQHIINQTFKVNKSESADLEVAGQIFNLLYVPEVTDQYVNIYGRDVTTERQAERMKSDFISMASHQLRTPLTAIRWYSDKMVRHSENLNDKQKEWSNDVLTTAIQLEELVDNLLNISRMERGKIELKPVLSSIIDNIYEWSTECQPAIENKQIKLELPDHKNLAKFVFDPDFIKQVYTNLLTNAIKYSPEKSTITVVVAKNDDQITVSVSDQGMGIPEASKAHIFERFFRAENVQKASIDGTGLGLAFAQMIVSKSGGKLWFESVENKGTTFYFTLPLS